MIRIAFFVEGKTERIFIENFLDNYYTHPFFNVESQELRGGRAKKIIKSNYEDNNIKYSFLIFDVGGDGSVAGAILERSKKLIESYGYNHILGIRDLYPNTREQLDLVYSTFNEIFQNDSILNDISLIIAVMEIEAWFLADYPFFLKVDNRLTASKINENLSIDIENDDLEEYRQPAKIIDKIYKIVGKRYKKRESDSYSICSHIDFDELCLNQNKRNRIPSFDSLINKIDEFE
ncbi:MAG: DUF4276 family protein [Bacteroidales bacterium]|jgi:hypothetical protein|nr:DUF4276 family protein [Bacteroidales bacterium]